MKFYNYSSNNAAQNCWGKDQGKILYMKPIMEKIWSEELSDVELESTEWFIVTQLKCER